MGRLSYRHSDDTGAELRPRALAPLHVFSRGWHMMLVFVMGALGWACGSEPVCPSGTGGSACSPSDDLGVPPDVPVTTRDRANDDSLSSDTPDAGTTDVEGDFELDTTTYFLREVPDLRQPTLPPMRESEGRLASPSDHATDQKRTVKCTVLSGEHIDSRGAPPGRPIVDVERDRGRHGWRYAA